MASFEITTQQILIGVIVVLLILVVFWKCIKRGIKGVVCKEGFSLNPDCMNQAKRDHELCRSNCLPTDRECHVKCLTRLDNAQGQCIRDGPKIEPFE